LLNFLSDSSECHGKERKDGAWRPKGVDMQPEPIPTEYFIQNCLLERTIRDLTDGWRIEMEQLQSILTQHFREMGIFFVAPGHAQMLKETLMHHLKHSVEIQRILKKLDQEELARRNTRMTET